MKMRCAKVAAGKQWHMPATWDWRHDGATSKTYSFYFNGTPVPPGRPQVNSIAKHHQKNYFHHLSRADESRASSTIAKRSTIAAISNLMKTCLLFTLLLFSFTIGFSQDGMVSGAPKLAYWKLGSAKQTIVVLHGGPATQHDYLRPEFDQLSANATLIYYDQRGCGRSEMAASYTWQEHVADLKRVIETVAKDKKVILAGSSWGSLLALAYTQQYPQDVKGLILTGTVQWFGLGLSSSRYESLKARGYKPRKEQVYTDTITEVRKSDTVLAEQIVQRALTTTWGPANLEPVYSFKTAPKMSSLKSIRVPVLIFTGDRKNCFIDWGHRYARVLPNAELFTVKDACHDPWLNNPTIFFERCSAFVNRLP